MSKQLLYPEIQKTAIGPLSTADTHIFQNHLSHSRVFLCHANMQHAMQIIACKGFSMLLLVDGRQQACYLAGDLLRGFMRGSRES
jgi:hypothetical protein